MGKNTENLLGLMNTNLLPLIDKHVLDKSTYAEKLIEMENDVVEIS
jgi:hypothetical protein